MKHLIDNEKALLDANVRRNPNKLASLLHPTFKEVGMSGETYDFDTVVANLLSESNTAQQIHAQHFVVQPLSANTALVTYQTALVEKPLPPSKFAKRVSVWQLENAQWQVIYHQGTPCQAFELEQTERG